MSQIQTSIERERLECPKCKKLFWIKRRQKNLRVSCSNCGWDGSFNYPDEE